MRARLATTATFLREQTLVRHTLGAVLALVVVIVVLTAASDYQSSVLTDMSYLAIAAGGLTVLTGLNGQISLGHGALMAFGAYSAALLLSERDSGTPLVVVVLVAVAVTSVVGLLVGIAAARLHGPYLAGATLALAVAVPGIPLYFKDLLADGAERIPALMPEIPLWATNLAYYLTGADPSRTKYVAFFGWVLVIITFFLLANLARGRIGRRWGAVRDDEVAAELAGINLGRTRVSAFVVSAAAAGAAGAVLAVKSRGVSPESFTLDLSLTLLAAVVLGGLGSLTGALIGAALLTVLDTNLDDLGIAIGMNQVDAAQLSPLVYGAVLVLVVLVAPQGLMGSLRALRQRRQARPPRPGSAGPSDPPGSADGPDPHDDSTGSTRPNLSTTSKGTP